MRLSKMNWEQKCAQWREVTKLLWDTLSKYETRYYDDCDSVSRTVFNLIREAITIANNAMNDANLKPCPLCGGKAKFFSQEELNAGYEDTANYIQCLKCGFQTKEYDDGLEAAKAWNNRPLEKR